MRPYVARVLHHPANWLVYSTALLERSWLDFESQYGRERAVMQIQVVCYLFTIGKISTCTDVWDGGWGRHHPTISPLDTQTHVQQQQ